VFGHDASGFPLINDAMMNDDVSDPDQEFGRKLEMEDVGLICLS
jgi:hypothetical protein